MNTWRIVVGDALERLRELDDGSVQTCITSPPYFGLRDYGTGSWEGGDEGCDHRKKAAAVDEQRTSTLGANRDGLNVDNAAYNHGKAFRDACGKCGATRTDSQLGLEATPDEYVARLVEVFREVRRVLRDDGTLWLNLGDSYASTSSGGDTKSGFNDRYFGTDNGGGKQADIGENYAGVKRSLAPGCKPKDLLGIPWMVAFALRADGWYLRSDIIWAKPNPMPESVTDRPTKAHEYVFLLSKSPRYFYDADAVREEHARLWDETNGGNLVGNAALQAGFPGESDAREGRAYPMPNPAGRNKRSVWTVATQPFPGAHFAVFPPKLIEPCVLAGSAEDACGVCGAPWERVVEKVPMIVDASGRRELMADAMGEMARTQTAGTMTQAPLSKTLGFEPSCDHQDKTSTSTVLDPFAGAGTTGLVATRLGRSFIGIELSATYAAMARDRILNDAPLFNSLGEAPPADPPEEQMSLDG